MRNFKTANGEAGPVTLVLQFGFKFSHLFFAVHEDLPSVFIALFSLNERGVSFDNGTAEAPRHCSSQSK